MTEPSQYFKGRTVQEQMNEVISYVDVRAEEVAAAKADDVLEPAEQAKTDAIAAKEAAEDARDATLAALPTIQQDIADLKAEDVILDGRLDTVELKVQTAEGNIVTIQGQIVALQTADGQNVKLTGTNAIGNYAVLLTGNQSKSGELSLLNRLIRNWDINVKEPPASYQSSDILRLRPPTGSENTSDIVVMQMVREAIANHLQFTVFGADVNDTAMSASFRFSISNSTGKASISVKSASGSYLSVWTEP